MSLYFMDKLLPRFSPWSLGMTVSSLLASSSLCSKCDLMIVSELCNSMNTELLKLISLGDCWFTNDLD